MNLQTLYIDNVRNIERIQLEAVQGINFIYGENGSGKSALLEAIYILGRAKSFRCNSLQKVIRSNQDALVISATGEKNGIPIQQGIQVKNKIITLRINGESVSRSDLAYSMPLQIIHPKSYLLLDGGSLLRREFMDWGAFHFYQDFLPAWRNFKKSLKQRNVLLKQKQIQQLSVWNHEIVQYGNIINQYRKQYIDHLQSEFNEILRLFGFKESFSLQFLSGWNEKESLLELLVTNQEQDLKYGFTHIGPHRDDFKLTINKEQAKDYVSRGQLKILMIALKLAQIRLLEKELQINSCILLDDLTSELDIKNRVILINLIKDLQVQSFITSTQAEEFHQQLQDKQYKMFHVEHGKVNS